MLSVVKGSFRGESAAFNEKLNAYGVQAAWLLLSWGDLEQFLSQPCEPSFEVSIGR